MSIVEVRMLEGRAVGLAHRLVDERWLALFRFRDLEFVSERLSLIEIAIYEIYWGVAVEEEV